MNLIWISLLFTVFNLPNPDIGRWPGLNANPPQHATKPAVERCVLRVGCL